MTAATGDPSKPPPDAPDYDQSVAGEEDPGASLEPAPLRRGGDAAAGTPCGRCGGSGRDDSGAACTECQGTGKVTAGSAGT